MNFIYNGQNALKRTKLSKHGFLEIPDIFINFNLIEKSRSQFFRDRRLNCYHLLGADYKELILTKEVIEDYELGYIFDDFYDRIIPILSQSLNRDIDKEMINISFQSIEMNPDIKDEQNYWHADCFYDTFKGFVFFDDVQSDGAPFTYLIGSHRIGIIRIIKEYVNSFNFNKFSSPRFNINSKNKNIREHTLKKNCLIIANTCGIHKRKKVDKKVVREGIYFYVRPNPYKLW